MSEFDSVDVGRGCLLEKETSIHKYCYGLAASIDWRGERDHPRDRAAKGSCIEPPVIELVPAFANNCGRRLGIQ